MTNNALSDLGYQVIWSGGSGLSTYKGCSSLSGPAITRHALGKMTPVTEADRVVKGKKTAPRHIEIVDPVLRVEVLSAGGVLPTSSGWCLVMDAHGRLTRRRSDPVKKTHSTRDAQRAYRVRMQSAFEQEWASTGPHPCRCGCGEFIPIAGHYGCPRQYVKGHSVRSTKANADRARRVQLRQLKRDLSTPRKVMP